MPKKKVLYAVQATGNGHIARAQEILPILAKYATVHVFVSGTQAQLPLAFKDCAYHSGISLFYNKVGGISYAKTFFKNNWLKGLAAILSLNVKDYDLVVNDFEPITAWASLLKKKRCVQMSHQAALLSTKVPKPVRKDVCAKVILRWFAPAKEHIGFHFRAYDSHIFPPVIRKKIKDLTPSTEKHYLVYLPSCSDDFIFSVLHKIEGDWHVFSKYCQAAYVRGNVSFFPIDDSIYLNHFATCKGVLCNAGFETPAEAMYLGKKLMVIPIKGQYEQSFNAAAAKELGVHVANKLKPEYIIAWMENGKPIQHDFSWDLESVLFRLLDKS